jgi:hypothetical protein
MIDDRNAILSSDTSSDAERLQVEGLRQMPPWRKLALVGEMNQTVRALVLAELRQRYPDDTPVVRGVAWPTCCLARSWPPAPMALFRKE